MNLSLMETRRRIEAITEPTARYTLKLSYLTACRANELCGIDQPGDTQELPDGSKHQMSRALGPRRSAVEYDTFEGTEVMRLNLGILKRRQDVQKMVALPLSGDFEPWAKGSPRSSRRWARRTCLSPTRDGGSPSGSRRQG